MTERVRIGTRGSPLALRQARLVADALGRAWPGLGVELVPIKTTGDKRPDANLAAEGGKGLFVKEIEEALLDGRVDLAVHSLKDLPAGTPKGLATAAFAERGDPRDVLVSRDGSTLDGLPVAARVGTSSPRRRAQLLAARPDLKVEAIRGNVDTRLRKLQDAPYDALVLAAAGLHRLGLEPTGAVVLPPEVMLPAVGQGTLAVETREDDLETRRVVAVVDHAETRAAALAERAFLAAIGGSCTTAVAAYARHEGAGLRLDALVASPDGTRLLRYGRVLHRGTPSDLGDEVARWLLEHGGREVLEQ
ncbi:MAG: hydroxymethylbilane synthase [Candidatus Rokuibacteriota bacterium]